MCAEEDARSSVELGRAGSQTESGEQELGRQAEGETRGLKEEQEQTLLGLLLRVVSGGCSGYKYCFELVGPRELSEFRKGQEHV